MMDMAEKKGDSNTNLSLLKMSHSFVNYTNPHFAFINQIEIETQYFAANIDIFNSNTVYLIGFIIVFL